MEQKKLIDYELKIALRMIDNFQNSAMYESPNCLIMAVQKQLSNIALECYENGTPINNSLLELIKDTSQSLALADLNLSVLKSELKKYFGAKENERN